MCSKLMVQKLVNTSKDMDESIDDLNRHAADAETVVRDIFRNKAVPLAEHFQTCFRQEVAIFSSSVNEGDRNAATS